ncbi:vacuolar ATPase assembly integral membrane protein vma21 [Borealophlyctis nickersoniae]|nr:vacuolar ATPase assembly integral membrane protein vma21 [Borealophlyctis nickersoniae]
MSEVRKRTNQADGSGAVSSTSKPASNSEVSPPKPVAGPAGGPFIPGYVIAKLVFFSFLLFVLPLSSYYYTLNNVFHGNTNYSAITAVIVANLVVIGYVIAAFTESDKDEPVKVKKTT